MKVTQTVVGLALAAAVVVAVSCSSGERDFRPSASNGGAAGEVGEHSAGTPATAGSDAGVGGADPTSQTGEGGMSSAHGGAPGAGGMLPELPTCEVKRDCGECQDCVEGSCAPVDPCVTDVQCESDADCTTPPGSDACFTPLCAVDGKCHYLRANEGSACGEPASCTGGVARTADACDALGLCNSSTKACGAYLCNTAENACYEECTSEAQCSVGLECANDACVVAPDAECDSDADCTSPPGSEACFTAVCAVGGECQYIKANEGTACGEPASCVGGQARTAEACDASGNCGSTSTACGAYACNTQGKLCYTQCSAKAQCSAGRECVDGACVVPLANGATCSQGAQCSSGQCGCKNATCTQRQCIPTACAACRYDANFNGVCEDYIATGSDDATNVCADYACNGAGACLKPLGSVCTAGNECTTGNCECSSSTCPNRVCTQLACTVCRFPFNGSCGGLSYGYGDRDTCSGNNTCDNFSNCIAKKPNGAPCTQNSDCAYTCHGSVCGFISDLGGSCDDVGDCVDTAIDCDQGVCD